MSPLRRVLIDDEADTEESGSDSNGIPVVGKYTQMKYEELVRDFQRLTKVNLRLEEKTEKLDLENVELKAKNSECKK